MTAAKPGSPAVVGMAHTSRLLAAGHRPGTLCPRLRLATPGESEAKYDTPCTPVLHCGCVAESLVGSNPALGEGWPRASRACAALETAVNRIWWRSWGVGCLRLEGGLGFRIGREEKEGYSFGFKLLLTDHQWP